jgi:epoxyqueuosine reductase
VEHRGGLAARLESIATDAGLAGFGICDAGPFPDVRREIERRVAEGSHGGLGFTYARPETATDIRSSFPWAVSLVVGAAAYLPAAGSPGAARAGTGRIARFATDDHYRPLREALGRVAGALIGAGHRAEVLVDDGRLVDRAAAVRAGVGWWGRNTMVLAPGAGPWLLLGSVVTDARLPATRPMVRDCGTCRACVPACPTGALDVPGKLDARRCLSAIAQSPGVIPAGLRAAMGDRVYGCDDCLEACPPGLRLLEGSERRHGRVDLVGILAADDRSLLRRFAHFYVPRRRARYLRRNALVALGNAGGPASVPVAAGFAGHPDPLLRAHAVWALGALGGPAALAALQAVSAREREPMVAAEVEAAIGAARRTRSGGSG